MQDEPGITPPGRDNITRLLGIARSEQDAALGDFVNYWMSMRRDGDVPRRSDVDPRGIERMLSNAFVAERIAPGLARLRIAGAHLSDLMGMEVRGMPVSAFITPEARDDLAHDLVRLFDEPATLRLTLQSEGNPALSGTMILLPLRSDLGDISRALGCLVTDGPLARAPHRFVIKDRKVMPLGNQAARPIPEKGASGFAQSKSRFKPPTPAQPGERPYLKLVKTD